MPQPVSGSLAGGGDPDEGADILSDVLAGRGNDACSTMVALNAGAAIYAGHPQIGSIREGVERASEIVDSGAARRKLDEFVETTQRLQTR